MTGAQELRTYTLADDATADRYAEVHWPRHVESLGRLGIETVGVWRAVGTASVVAIVEYPDGADPAALTAAFMASDDFRADMAGFEMADIRRVDVVPIRPLPR